MDYFEYGLSQFGFAEFWVAILILFSCVFMVFNINIHLVWFCFCFKCYSINCRIIHPELCLCFVSKWPMSLSLTQEIIIDVFHSRLNLCMCVCVCMYMCISKYSLKKYIIIHNTVVLNKKVKVCIVFHVIIILQ